MKTIKNLLVVLCLLVAFNATAQKTKALPQDVVFGFQKFKIELRSYDCFLNGKTVVARVVQLNGKYRSKYRFMWEVDGKPQGHRSMIECATGKVATVHVTQYPSGIRFSKSIKLNDFPDR